MHGSAKGHVTDVLVYNVNLVAQTLIVSTDVSFPAIPHIVYKKKLSDKDAVEVCQ